MKNESSFNYQALLYLNTASNINLAYGNYSWGTDKNAKQMKNTTNLAVIYDTTGLPEIDRTIGLTLDIAGGNSTSILFEMDDKSSVTINEIK